MSSSGKKLKGFMCHCPASTVVCMSQEYRSPGAGAGPGPLKHQPKYARLGAAKSASCNLSFRDNNMNNQEIIIKEETVAPPPPEPSLAASSSVFQVVVMRVSIHCRGCAGKLKKHLSKMEGVTSFSIDLESKRVTVMGHVSPSGVLESVSKVKKAEFWPCL
ncbi:protein SODIUM POTASSIUM ROOT DEFECTIVE 1-like [Andrographis paniculata]|uniref:protein SODIUM POTASSIUM ROOT DEFECTIVE 1-like n=1 Tax=Andrographis paniculata TaxID=175694 RepID=UPI0021E8D154|nr:protein SODIUM POTASSIUM ROOT DEFECTIVE 1-like [Andrographis paniculata]